jgi:hypothetical protein
MFPSQDNQFQENWIFWPCCEIRVFLATGLSSEKKHPFVLKLLGYSKDREAYIQQKFQLEIPSFTGENCCWISDFQNLEIQ